MGIEIHINDARGGKIKFFIISTYLPCSQYTDQDYDTALQQVQTMIDQKPKKSILIIRGDMNANICITTKQEKLFEEHDKVTGRYGNSSQNNRGERLRTFLGVSELVSTATLFDKPNYNT